MRSKSLEEYVKLFVEERIREIDTLDGNVVEFGSQEHIADLERSISDMQRHRDRHRRGTEARANYARVISRLKQQLMAARRAAEKMNPTIEQ